MEDKIFEEEYKRLFDSIHASGELKKKVLMQRRKKRDIRPYIAAAGAAAAGLMIFTAVHNTDLSDKGDGVISETKVESTAAPAPVSDNAANLPQPAQEGNKKDAGVSAPASKPRSQQQEAQDASGSYSRTMTTEDYMREALEKSGLEPDGSRSGGERSASVPERKENTEEDTATYPQTHGRAETETAPPAGGAAQSNTESGTAETEAAGAAADAFAMNNDMMPKASDQSSGGGSGAAPASAYSGLRAVGGTGGVMLNTNPQSVYERYSSDMPETFAANAASNGTVEEWDNEKYFEYTGSDLVENVTEGTDLEYTGGDSSYITVDENGEPVNDSRIFSFEGESGEYAAVHTSKDTTYSDAYLADPELAKSDIYGTEAVVFETGDDEYKCYMVSDGVSYITDTEGLDETELSGLLAAETGNTEQAGEEGQTYESE